MVLHEVGATVRHVQVNDGLFWTKCTQFIADLSLLFRFEHRNMIRSSELEAWL